MKTLTKKARTILKNAINNEMTLGDMLVVFGSAIGTSIAFIQLMKAIYKN